VLLAGPGITGERILLMQEALISRASGKPENEIKDMTSISKGALDMVAQSGNVDSLKKDLTAYMKNKINTDSAFAKEAGDNKEQFIASQVRELVSPWMRYFISFDPAPTLEKVRCPVLAVDGSKDLQVPPETDLEAIKAALKKGGNNKVTIIEFPNLNHLFQECTTGSPDEYANIEQTFSPFALNEVSNWILKQVK
jgi:pimeloyl-ACP methyl ester carboxylesterase